MAYYRLQDGADEKNRPGDPFQMFPNRGGLGVTTPIHWVHNILDNQFENFAGTVPGVLVPFPYSWDDVDRGNMTKRCDPRALIHETGNWFLFQICLEDGRRHSADHTSSFVSRSTPGDAYLVHHNLSACGHRNKSARLYRVEEGESATDDEHEERSTDAGMGAVVLHSGEVYVLV